MVYRPVRELQYSIRSYLPGLGLFGRVDGSLFTYVKGIGVLLALFFLLYPAVLGFQLLTGTVTETGGQIGVLSVLSLLAWASAIRMYREYDSEEMEMIGAK